MLLDLSRSICLSIASMVPLYYLAGQIIGEDDDTKDFIPLKRFKFYLDA